MPHVVIGEHSPIDTFKLQQSSPLSGLDQEVSTLWSKGWGRGRDGEEFVWESHLPAHQNPQACRSLLSPCQTGVGNEPESEVELH